MLDEENFILYMYFSTLNKSSDAHFGFISWSELLLILVTHIYQLKTLTAIYVSQKQKKSIMVFATLHFWFIGTCNVCECVLVIRIHVKLRVRRTQSSLPINILELLKQTENQTRSTVGILFKTLRPAEWNWNWN